MFYSITFNILIKKIGKKGQNSFMKGFGWKPKTKYKKRFYHYPMAKNINLSIKGEIIGMNKSGKSIREISTDTHIPKSTIGNIVKKYK